MGLARSLDLHLRYQDLYTYLVTSNSKRAQDLPKQRDAAERGEDLRQPTAAEERLWQRDGWTRVGGSQTNRFVVWVWPHVEEPAEGSVTSASETDRYNVDVVIKEPFERAAPRLRPPCDEVWGTPPPSCSHPNVVAQP